MPVAAASQNKNFVVSRAAFSAEQDWEISDMRAFLARVRPQSTAEALRLLRNAYPEAPLGHRVAACGLSRD